MPRQLLVLRHAKSAWDTGAPTDFDRPLAKRGRKDAPRMGEWLRDTGLVPDHVVSSPANRARETTAMVCNTLGFATARVVWDGRIYEGTVGALLEVLADCPATAPTTLLVGHNPGLEMLVRWLGGDAVRTPLEGKLLPTAAVARVKMPESWSALGPGAAKVVSIMWPKQLGDQALRNHRKH